MMKRKKNELFLCRLSHKLININRFNGITRRRFRKIFNDESEMMREREEEGEVRERE
jgi:hypothetical protein